MNKNDEPKSESPKTTLVKKKKLEFSPQKNSEDMYDNTEYLDILEIVENKRIKLEALQRHQIEQNNLLKEILKWKKAGLDGLDKLRESLSPPRTNEEIINSFNIPQEIFLLNDEEEIKI